MCRTFEETRLEGERYGRLKKAIEIAKRMIERNRYTFEEIAYVVDLPIETVLELTDKKTM